MADDGEKTHAPTPLRREEHRKQGQFARSRDASALAAAAAAVAALVGTREDAGHAVTLLFSRTLGDAGALVRGDADPTWRTAIGVLFALTVPALVASVLGAIVVGAAQAGLRFDSDLIEFKLDRLNPVPRLQQLFSLRHAFIETALALLRVGVVGYLAYEMVKSSLPALLHLVTQPPSRALSSMIDEVLALTLRILGGLILLSVADYAQSRFQLEQQMKMSFKELKDEMRQQEGDPKQKGRLRARARALAKRRMMNDVKKADVVVTNPTHVSVALRYQRTDPAPIVVAKGHDEAALHIRAEARKYGIPIMESRSLARALDAEVKVGHPIPGAHYGAVAHVLAFVFRLRGRRGPRRA